MDEKESISKDGPVDDNVMIIDNDCLWTRTSGSARIQKLLMTADVDRGGCMSHRKRIHEFMIWTNKVAVANSIIVVISGNLFVSAVENSYN